MVRKSRGLPQSTDEEAQIHLKPADWSDMDELLSAPEELVPSPMPNIDCCKVIDSLFVPVGQRRRGLGTKLLKRVCRRADTAGIWLIANAYPWEVLESPHINSFEHFEAARERLVQFYCQQGFVDIGDGWCYRRPKRTK